MVVFHYFQYILSALLTDIDSNILSTLLTDIDELAPHRKQSQDSYQQSNQDLNGPGGAPK